MPTGVTKGAFAHVAGTFDLAAKEGTIDYVTPVSVATDSKRLRERAHPSRWRKRTERPDFR
jgi:hypothetical protein